MQVTMWTKRTALVFVSVLAAHAQSTTGWKLVWSDEFNGPAGAAPDPGKWNYDLGGGGWGNGEIEVYTNSTSNAFQDGKGNLVLRAIRDASGHYTSARIQTGAPTASTHTTDLSWQFGRIEARIKLPFGQGVWPAFWMLGEDIGAAGWPACGEIDIMENFGTYHNNAGINNGTAHGPGYSGGNGISKSYTLPFGEKAADDYHVYAIQWSQDSVEWLVDGVSFHKVTPASLPSGSAWVFNAPFFLLLNLAVGGPATFLGTPDPGAPFPNRDMLVDYVRVYQAAAIRAATPVINPGQVINAASFLGTVAPGSLATLSGYNLADAEHVISPEGGSFPTSVAGVSVTVDGVASALTYVSPAQINFQVPWETAPGTAIDVQVTRDGVASNVETITIGGDAAPSLFLSEFTNGVAWVTGPGCAVTECAVQAGGIYQLWGNGFGPKNEPGQDGVPATAPLTGLSVLGGPDQCVLTIGGQPAQVLFCGAAPLELIDQLNFIYPSGVAGDETYADATLAIRGATGRFRVPAPGSP